FQQVREHEPRLVAAAEDLLPLGQVIQVLLRDPVLPVPLRAALVDVRELAALDVDEPLPPRAGIYDEIERLDPLAGNDDAPRLFHRNVRHAPPAEKILERSFVVDMTLHAGSADGTPDKSDR